jgi:hypothetical protein
MKVENHDTTKLGNQHENLLKREIQKINVNKYQTLFNNVVSSFCSYCTYAMRIY